MIFCTFPTMRRANKRISNNGDSFPSQVKYSKVDPPVAAIRFPDVGKSEKNDRSAQGKPNESN